MTKYDVSELGLEEFLCLQPEELAAKQHAALREHIINCLDALKEDLRHDVEAPRRNFSWDSTPRSFEDVMNKLSQLKAASRGYNSGIETSQKVQKETTSAPSVAEDDVEWKLIPGFPSYRINRNGEVQHRYALRHNQWHTVNQPVSRMRGQVAVWYNYKGATLSINRLVGRLFGITAARTLPPIANEWRVVPGFPAYEVSCNGCVRNRKTKRHLKWRRVSSPYNCAPQVRLTGHTTRSVGSLVAAAFLPNYSRSAGLQYKDGNRWNPKLDNLIAGNGGRQYAQAV